jgi:hypothetical protein
MGLVSATRLGLGSLGDAGNNNTIGLRGWGTDGRLQGSSGGEEGEEKTSHLEP